MPDNYPLFATRTMLAALEQMYPARTFLKDLFFKKADPVTTENIDIDIYKGKRRTATYVSPNDEGNVMSRVGFTTFSYKPPYIKEKMALKPTDLLNRQYGATIYQAESPLQRAERQLALDLATLDDAITRAEELQASQALFQGQIQLLDGNWLIFPQAPTHQITSLEYLWTDTEDSDPLKDLGTWRKLILRDSGLAPDVVVLGTDALEAFLNHPKISGNTAALSQVKIDRGQIDPKVLENGVIYWGYISEIGCDLYSYDEWYVPPDAPENTEAVPMVPLNAVMMGCTRARMDVAYGPILDMEALQPFARFPKSWTTEDPSVRWLMLQSAPLLIPVQVDSYLFATVCALSNAQLG